MKLREIYENLINFARKEGFVEEHKDYFVKREFKHGAWHIKTINLSVLRERLKMMQQEG